VDKVRIDYQKKRGGMPSGFLGGLLKVLGIIVTFNFVCFCWIFFKAATFQDAWSLIHQVVYDFQPEVWLELYNGYTAVFWIMLLGLVLHFLPKKAELTTESLLGKVPVVGNVVIMVLFIWLLAQVKSSQPMMPIYLQF
jgi:uncharacterized membrane protein